MLHVTPGSFISSVVVDLLEFCINNLIYESVPSGLIGATGMYF